MKKLVYISMIAAAGLFFTACEPDIIKGGEACAPVTPTEIMDGLSYTQYADEECTTPQTDGNYIKYESKAGVIQWFTVKDDGTEKILCTGAAGVFNITPKRGNSPQQTAYARLANQDGTMTQIENTFTVYVPADLSADMKLLVGDAGAKYWAWDFDAPTGSTCWGNGGTTSGSAFDAARTVDGHWWGVSTPEGLTDQLQHSNTGVATGEEDSNAYMLFDEDGNVATYTAAGEVVRAGTYEIQSYDPTRSGGWEIGKLVTSEPAILFPFSINEGGKTVTEFDIMHLDANYMTLAYTKGNAAGSWGEMTHWMFKNISDYAGMLTDGSSKKWGWANDGYEVWGNAGNSGGGASFAAANVDGKWWGVTSAADLTGQLSHSDTGVATGEEDDNAYMIFDAGGTVKTCAADGTVIREGTFSFSQYTGSRNEGWELAKFTTPESAILFPFSINEGGKKVTEFDVMYIDQNNMTLVYTKGNGAGSWGEITYWRFAAK